MGINKYTPNPRNYYKTNFVELVELITPEVYKERDLELSGTELNPISDLVNRHVALGNNISDVFSISGVANTQTSSLGSISGIAPYFVKQNALTNINPYLFETKILVPLGRSLSEFDTSGEFFNYLSGTLLPLIVPATQTETGSLEENITTLSALTDNSDASSVHNHLVDALGWFYFLNTSADGGLDYSPSSYVLSSLNSLYLGKTLETVDGVKGVTEYLWRNNETCSFGSYIPQNFVSGAADAVITPSAGVLATYTSGTQKLEALQTLVDIVYSPLYIDQQDYTVKDAFDSFVGAGTDLDDRISSGPHRKFNTLLGLQFADISDEIENIGLIYDIENVQEDYLQYIAQLIGFKLRGNSPAKWRHQLRLAVDLYKRSGTLEALQVAINALIVDSVFDLSGQVQELWESYIPHLIWYALGTESPLFHDLNTWTHAIAQEAGVYNYSTSSLEENLKIVTDSILLDLYKAFPKNFLFHGKPMPVPELWELDDEGNEVKRYTIIGDPAMKPFLIYEATSTNFNNYKQWAKKIGQSKAWDASLGSGPLGSGVYVVNGDQEAPNSQTTYLKFKGDLEFLFNYRGKINYPMPPFEEVKYYRDSTVTAPLVDYLVERLKCFKVKDSFADEVGNFIVSSAVTSETDLGALNEFLMFFSSTQTPPNFDDVMLSISDYENNLLPLWNGKSSHLFINFSDTDFDFSKTTLEGDGKYALYEAARVAKEFSPAHTITRVNLTASAEEEVFDVSSTRFHYLGLDHGDTRALYTSAAAFGNFEFSGTTMAFAAGGGDDADLGSDDGRGGLNTFKRGNVNEFTDLLISSTASITDQSSVARRALRRRNLKYLLPLEGYYDRTGFNGPVSYDPSTLEESMPSSLGELTLGYVASAGKFYPVVDPINPSSVWSECEDFDSPRSFSGTPTSATFPYRGLSSLGSNAKILEESEITARYVDRGQLPKIYNIMHEFYELKARDNGNKIILETDSYDNDAYWKNNSQSLANSAIASGFALNSFADYENFQFGKGPHQLHRDYCKYFAKHELGANEIEKTGGNIFAQVLGKGLFNCDLKLDGSAVGGFVASSVYSSSAINASSVWNETANGTFVASGTRQSIIPLSGTFTQGAVNNADFRNPAILSGIEFCDISGAPSSNQFTIFEVDPEFSVPGKENYLIKNRIIKCKSVGGLPRIRFDLSSYGDRRNYFIKDHRFNLNIKALVAEENSAVLGGGSMGVWIHTDPSGGGEEGLIWSWTPNQKWEPIRQEKLSLSVVKDILSHKHNFFTEVNPTTCLGNLSKPAGTEINDNSLNNIKESYFEDVSIKFDTRNFTDRNGFEYLKIIPIEEEEYIITEQVNTDETNYVVEIFFFPNNDTEKYMLIDNIELQDLTLRDRAGIGTGYGIESSGTPLRPFVKENKLVLSKDQIREVLKLYNGLVGLGTGQYATNLASRDATITSGIMEVSGGSRLNYRLQPDWVIKTKSADNQYTSLRFDN